MYLMAKDEKKIIFDMSICYFGNAIASLAGRVNYEVICCEWCLEAKEKDLMKVVIKIFARFLMPRG